MGEVVYGIDFKAKKAREKTLEQIAFDYMGLVYPVDYTLFGLWISDTADTAPSELPPDAT